MSGDTAQALRVVLGALRAGDPAGAARVPDKLPAHHRRMASKLSVGAGKGMAPLRKFKREGAAHPLPLQIFPS
ncbi:hypothetical protein [Variovorax sp. J22R115]|uniref:hypothetical protein n=1 Tax=Variovorax sp. J22R115 TaxID=3053509 RepID=UPI002574D926|nr:hypothetical protein [Variovorax sp. J22R115]MDM0048125.1 hypothetical protein [Variovorax sp. J22R115]